MREVSPFIPTGKMRPAMLSALSPGELFLWHNGNAGPSMLGVRLDLSPPDDEGKTAWGALSLTPWWGRDNALAVFTQQMDDAAVVALGAKAEVEVDPLAGTAEYSWDNETRLAFANGTLLLKAKNAGNTFGRGGVMVDTASWARSNSGDGQETSIASWRIVGRWDDQVIEFVRHSPPKST